MTQQPPSFPQGSPSPQPPPTPQPHPTQQGNSTATAGPAAEQRPRLMSGFSLAQIIGGALAAATAAALGARLGVAGTVIGAAFASLIAAVGGKLYSETLRRTHYGLSGAISRQGRATTRANDGVVSTRKTGAANVPAMGVRGRRRRFGTSAVALSALASFALAAVTVTMIETGTGRSLDGATTSTASQIITQTTRVPVKAGGPPTATASQAPGFGPAGGDGQSGGSASQPPPPNEPTASDGPTPVASAPADPGATARPAPGDGPSADSAPSAPESSAPATPAPSSGGSQT